MLVRLPNSWKAITKLVVKGLGWVGAIVVMMLVRYKDGSGFSVNRSDIIILVLSNVAVFGALIWLATRQNLLIRLGMLGILIALRLASVESGWVQWLWNISPAPWLFQVRFLQYLFITIPGTIVGDYLLKWMTAKDDSGQIVSWSGGRRVALSLIMVAINVIVVVGLKARWVEPTIVVVLLLCALAWWLCRNPVSSIEVLMNAIFTWAICWLILGFFFEPYEGGIKKDHATVSYYFVTTGLAIMMLIAFTIAIDVFRKARWFNLLITSGQNPLVAYAGVNSLVPPVLGLLSLDKLIESITPTPWLGALRGAFMTYLVAVAASVCSKKKLFLKT
jgi:hypothetical protein